jgi:hypothetical protein
MRARVLLWREVAAPARLEDCELAFVSGGEGSSRMLFTSEATNPQAAKKSVGIFVGINIFWRPIAH